MMPGSFVVTLSAWLSASALLPAVLLAGGPPDTSARPRIVALGDSLTSGHGIGAARAYPAVLQERIDEEGLPFEVVNAGVSGATSSDGVRRLSAALQGHVQILIVALGANDGLRGVPVERLTSNLTRIITEAQSRNIDVVLCGMDALPIYGWNYTVAFHQTYRQLAEQFHVPLVPFMLSGVIANQSMMQRDGIHPNASGARQIAENIWPYLEPLVHHTVGTR